MNNMKNNTIGVLKFTRYIMYLLIGTLLFMSSKYENENLLTIHILILFLVCVINSILTLKVKQIKN